MPPTFLRLDKSGKKGGGRGHRLLIGTLAVSSPSYVAAPLIGPTTLDLHMCANAARAAQKN